MTLALVIAIGCAAACSPACSASAAGSSSCRRSTLVLGLTQLHAEATSLLAILPTRPSSAPGGSVGYGNVDLRVAAWIGVASIAGVEVGVLVAEALPGARRCGGSSGCCCCSSTAPDRLADCGRDREHLPGGREATRSGSRWSTSRSARSSSSCRPRTRRSTRSSSGARRILAFRTFAYIRVGILLGRLLVENDVPGIRRLRDLDRGAAARRAAPARRSCGAARGRRGDRGRSALRATREAIGPDDEARARFREFAAKHSDSTWREALASSTDGAPSPRTADRPRRCRRGRLDERRRRGGAVRRGGERVSRSRSPIPNQSGARPRRDRRCAATVAARDARRRSVPGRRLDREPRRRRRRPRRRPSAGNASAGCRARRQVVSLFGGEITADAVTGARIGGHRYHRVPAGTRTGARSPEPPDRRAAAWSATRPRSGTGGS